MSEPSAASGRCVLSRVGVVLCLTVLVFAFSLALTSCGTSKRVQRSSTLWEEPLDSLPEIDQLPELIKEGKPKYPKKAKEAGWEGIVWVSVLVDTQGKVKDVKIGRSSGYNEFDDAATRAAWKNKFKPAILDGKPVTVWATYKVDFSIGDKKSHGQ